MLVAQARRRLQAIKSTRWEARDVMWAALTCALGVSVAMIGPMALTDTKILSCSGRYVWEAASVVGILWTAGMFRLRPPICRLVAVGGLLIGMAAMSIWVCDWTLRFFNASP